MTKFLKNLWKLPRNRITASFLGRESAKRATKSREVPRHIKSDKGLFFESLIIERQKIQEKLQEAVCCRFCQGSVELLENVSSKTGLGSAWLVRCENENCPSQKTKWSFFYNRKDRTEQSPWNKLFICCRVSFLTFSCCVTIVVPSLVCINIDSFGVIYGAKNLFSLFSRNENQGKLRVRFKLQVGNPWTNLAEIWLTYCQLVFLKTVFFVCEFWILFSFSS